MPGPIFGEDMRIIMIINNDNDTLHKVENVHDLIDLHYSFDKLQLQHPQDHVTICSFFYLQPIKSTCPTCLCRGYKHGPKH